MGYTRKVFYYETDQMGIVHHSNYIRWFEETRLEWLSEHGFPYDRMEKDGIISPVLGVECDYKSMTHYGDTVVVDLMLDEFKGIKMTFAYVVKDATTGEVRATGKSRHCFLNKDGRPVSIKKEFPELYATITESLEKKED